MENDLKNFLTPQLDSELKPSQQKIFNAVFF